MTDNRVTEAAWTYHDATKHSYTSIRTNPHFMDWSNQPLPFKIYPALEPMSFPGEVRQTGVAALPAIGERGRRLAQRLEWHLLGQRRELPSLRLPSLGLGHRPPAPQLARRSHRPGSAFPSGLRLRGQQRQPPARRRAPA